MKKNLFIVGSPLQVINALEAIEHFGLKNIVFVVIYNGLSNNILQTENYLKKVNCEEIIKIQPASKSKFFRYVKLIRYLKKYRYANIFTGEFGSVFRVILSNLKKDKVFLIDDGVVTIRDYINFVKPNKLNTYSYRELRFLLVGLKIFLKGTINFFTYFKLEPIEGIDIVKNNLTFLKKDFISNNIDYSDTVFFLGQPLDMFKDSDEFIYALKEVSYKFFNKKIIYFPHRAEREYQLELVRKTIPSIEIQIINQPIEYYFINNGICPKFVISYVSTALFTTKLLFNDCEVKYIKIKNLNLNIVSEDYLQEIYKYFDKEDILELEILN
ncbi:alpha-2,8-polysialyltransferase family protein [Aliarcobacter cryaerophilus]|uniref:alpha-2,8-polysialyltransferase family protein n=1 Tax=Aliarcobacter cryaerophilus TaxID=28198 RepID=UPI0021B4AEDF|nr:alpha-2,8-polysialyltransferase family protein [Aliarcobacter cryaerophilus]MCT7502092.1 alpha-2,8-polysialyltransferase family protein [Aliarcobacter cryaerophilus]